MDGVGRAGEELVGVKVMDLVGVERMTKHPRAYVRV